MSLLDTLDPSIAAAAKELYALAERAGAHPHVTSARRSYAQQNRLYQAFVAGRSRYPAAPPGTSAHEYGLAFDLVVPSSTDQIDLGSVWVSWGGVYGGEEDPIHFQAPGFKAPTSAAVGQSSSSRTSSIEQKALQLADVLVTLLPGPLQRIVGTAAIANAIVQIVGTVPDPVGFLLWGLSHPFEFLQAIWGDLWPLFLA